MTCESVRKNLSLFLYGELSFEDEEAIAGHLDGCDGCREELEREKRLHGALDLAETKPSAELLERCRLDLDQAVHRTEKANPRPSGWLERLRDAVRAPAWVSAAWLRPAGAVALVALGFFAARVTQPESGRHPARIRYIEPSPSGDVRIVVDETRQRVLAGRLDDEHIQGLLLTAVRAPSDPGVRAESLELLRERSGSREVMNALLYVLENDPNDGVRLKALESLRPFAASAESRRALSRVVLNDENPGVRTMAIDLLVRSDERDVVETLQELMRKEDNNYIRLRSQEALEAMNASVEAF
mgnify:CR=1 FL=1